LEFTAMRAGRRQCDDVDENSRRKVPNVMTGSSADFHSLRHGFITYLVTANVPPKVAQMLARHSTMTLTMERYTHLEIVDLVDGLKRLSAMTKGNGGTKEAVPRRTGTDGL
jgi:integrase